MRYFIWIIMFVGLVITLGATLFGNTQNPYVMGIQIGGVLVCGIAGIVAIVGKAGDAFRKRK